MNVSQQKGGYKMKGKIVYQIFPDRFNKSSSSETLDGISPWGSEVTPHCFMGGDLQGITNKVPYLSELGVEVLYLNPIFQSPTNHKYDTVDYYKIDPSFGSLEDFKKLLTVCHQYNISVIIDGVFNHTNPGFFAFKDIMEKGEASQYKDWYTIFNYPVEVTSNPNYRSFCGVSTMPQLNGANREVQKYITDVIRYWESLGIDGLRLDVPYFIDDSMLEEIRKSTSLYIVGEIWGLGRKFVPKYFDGIMNYSFRDLLKRAVVNRAIEASIFIDEWNYIEETYGENIHYCFSMSGSHDTERFFNYCGGDIEKEKLFYAFLFLFPGMPLVYYGDEIGMAGGNDPYCRGTMEWDSSKWNRELYDYIKGLITLRKNSKALQLGSISFTGYKGCMLAFERIFGKEKVKIYINFGSEPQIIDGLELEGYSFRII